MSRWLTRGVSAVAVVVVAWILLTAWPVVVHGHPLYAILLGLTVIGAAVAFGRTFTPRPPRRGWRFALWVLSVIAALAWIAIMAWLRPFAAEEPALTAMASDASVTVTQSPTAIVMTPTMMPPTRGLLFQPGARVDARAYASLLRPAAAAGNLVVIPKQPVGIAFLATGALNTARAAHPEITEWVVAGHSLGGTVASANALADTDAATTAPVAGLLLFASFPASDSSAMSAAVLSISGSQDGLATPADIDASKANLPPDARFLVIEGAPHSYFGDYGLQPGDGQATVSREAAAAQISAATVEFLAQLAADQTAAQ